MKKISCADILNAIVRKRATDFMAFCLNDFVPLSNSHFHFDNELAAERMAEEMACSDPESFVRMVGQYLAALACSPGIAQDVLTWEKAMNALDGLGGEPNDEK